MHEGPGILASELKMPSNFTTTGLMLNQTAFNETGLVEDSNQTNDGTEGLSEEHYTIFGNFFGFSGVALSIVCCIGVIANLLNIIVLSAAVRKKNFVTYKIFLCMAVADFVAMAAQLSYSAGYMAVRVDDIPRAMKFYQGRPPNLNVSYSYYFWGQTYYYVTNYAMFVSNWMAVLMNLFRLLAVSFPLKAPIIASKLSVNISIVAVIILGLIAAIPTIVARRIDEYGKVEYIKERKKYLTINTILIDIISLFVCLALTIILTVKLKLNTRKRIKLGMPAGSREQKSITFTLIIISVMFIVLNMCNAVYWIMTYSNKMKEWKISTIDQNFMYCFGILLMYTGYAANFFVYVAGNASFRNDLLAITGLKKFIQGHSEASGSSRLTNLTKASLSNK